VPYWSITAVIFYGIEASGRGIRVGDERKEKKSPTNLVISVKNII